MGPPKLGKGVHTKHGLLKYLSWSCSKLLLLKGFDGYWKCDEAEYMSEGKWLYQKVGVFDIDAGHFVVTCLTIKGKTVLFSHL